MRSDNDINGSHYPFRSFLMGGFECADHLNAFGERIDLLQMTGHMVKLEEDYYNLRSLGIKTVREGIRWSAVETSPYQYNWSEVEQMMTVADKMGVQVIWDICHFGFPDDLTPLHPMFSRRFAHLCEAFVLKFRSLFPEEPLIVTPINEVSFLSWLGGDVRGTSPYCIGQGWEVKYHLMKAYIEGIEMMKAVDPNMRIMTTEPLVSIVSEDQSDSISVLEAAAKHQEQFQVLEILSGKICPELRGKPEYLDLIGVNFYYNNQWTAKTHQILPWGEEPAHPLWRSLQSLIEEVFIRFGRPVIISETSHPGEHRPEWLKMIRKECVSLMKSGIPLLGCCIYPVIDRPDWDFTAEWHQSGIWDIRNPETLERVLHKESFDTLNEFNFMIKKSSDSLIPG